MEDVENVDLNCRRTADRLASPSFWTEMLLRETKEKSIRSNLVNDHVLLINTRINEKRLSEKADRGSSVELHVLLHYHSALRRLLTFVTKQRIDSVQNSHFECE
ncbi:Uncharacterized protein DAT39_002845 [Clarias magur]|uniref:Uncharacterized protein n=1 Tax=Clarias magur TaxID=1594786 RepID=A0A8J4XG65_CLAMG|nr:Uncharacterized protein DAT39_002845 [Clarias magur]